MTLESKVPHMIKYLQDQGLKKKHGRSSRGDLFGPDRMTEVVTQCRSCKKYRKEFYSWVLKKNMRYLILLIYIADLFQNLTVLQFKLHVGDPLLACCQYYYLYKY